MKMLTVLLFLSGPAMAQTYDLSLSLNGQTYSGDFTFTPNTMVNDAGATVAGPGVYSNVSVSDPYAGTLTGAWDVYGGVFGQHELWFTNAAGAGLLAVSIPTSPGNTPMVGMGAFAYTGSGSLDYTTCSACASITEVISNGIRQAPELDPAGGMASITLLAGLVLILKARVR